MDGIAVAGSILVDKINTIDGYPERGQLAQIRKSYPSIGGLVPNVGLDLKKISPDLPVFAYGRVGKDDDGVFALSQMEKGGVNVANVRKDEALRTSFTEVMSVPEGERTFFCYAGANSRFGAEDIDFRNLQVKMFHLGYFLLLEKIDNGDGLTILQRLKEQGILTSIDLVSENSTRYRKVLPCLPYVDNLIVNELEASALTGISDLNDMKGMCERLKDYGVRERVIVHKREGGYCFNGNTFISVPAFQLPGGWIRGKTGAGDAFTAGCLTAIYEGRTEEEMLDFGNRCAAVSLREENAVDGMTRKEEIYHVTEGIKRIC